MDGAGRREPPAAGVSPPHVAASGGCRGVEQDRGDPGRREQTRGGARRSPSFLSDDGAEGSVCPGVAEAGPLCSTRRSLLQELGGGCGLGEPPALSIPSLTPQRPPDPWGSALPPQPLASSTMLSAGDEPGEGPSSWTWGGRMGGPRWALPEPSAGDHPSPSPHSGSSPGVPLSPPQPCSRVLGGHRAPPKAPLSHGGLASCSVTGRSPGDRDIPAQHRPGVPRAVGWAGLGTEAPAAPPPGTAGAGGWDRSSLGDSSGDTECFISAVETLEPSEAGGCPGARHRWSPCPMAAGGLELGEAPSPTRAAAWELPPTRPPNAERARGEDLGGRSRVAPRCGGGSDVGDGGELLAQLQGCSLRGSPPATPGPLCSPASVSAGNVTPHGQDPPRDRHVTPRTKSRLQASAARLSASPSSPLFHEPLEVPRRPPRLRAPRGVPRDPAATLGHHVTPRGERGRGTGSLGDTEILLRAPSLPQGAGGSPGSSPTALLCRGDHGHPQGPPCATGSPNPGVLEGGSEWQDPSPLGTPQLPWLHRSLSRLLAPRLPGSTAAELGGRAVPLLPAGCSTRFSEEHLEDEEREQAPSPEGTAGVQDGRTCPVPPRRLSDEALRRRLRALGDNPGPVTELTRRLYLRRLEKLARGPQGSPPIRPVGPCGVGVGVPVRPDTGTTAAGHSPELVAALQTGHVPDCAQDELVLTRQFDRPDRSRRWREGLVKSSFNYLLLDPRTTQNLPLRSHRLSQAECFRTFVKAIFYVGKGTRARPYCHLTQALSQHRAGTQRGCPKVRRILEIWASGQGVVSVHCFQGTVPAEAYTREGCLVEALGLQTITNQRKGHCYGAAASWPAQRRRRLGVHMLHRAMRIFLAEGERQLRPADVQGGR